jgi:hypothetical protein
MAIYTAPISGHKTILGGLVSILDFQIPEDQGNTLKQASVRGQLQNP